MPLHLHFLGAAATVTGSQYLLETSRARVLIDCGMFQGPPQERMRNFVPLGYDPATVDALLLTHAHLDHCGLIPRVVTAGYAGPIYATQGTAELAALVLLDSGRLQEEFAKRELRWERRHPDRAVIDDRKEHADYQAALDLAELGETLADSPAITQPVGSLQSGEHVPTTIEPADGDGMPRSPFSAPTRSTAEPDVSLATTPTTPTSVAGEARVAAGAEPDSHLPHSLEPDPNLDLDAPLYTERDARLALTHFRPIRYGVETEVAPGVHATWLDAGHILGSAIIRVRVEGDGSGEPERVIVFSGDLGRPGAPILRDYTTVRDADYVLVESTYGGREHEPEEEAIRVLAETVRLVAESNGVLLVPSFAIGRTQDIVYELDRLIAAGTIPLLPLYLDSPMASKATEIYRRHPEDYDDEARKVFDAGDTPLDYPKQTITTDVHDSEAIERAPRPYMIVASNGMLTGGRIIGHLRNLIGDRNATLLFVGYQGVGTLGAHLQSGAKRVKISGQIVEVRCNVRSISGFSAHADELGLLAWLRGFVDGRAAGDRGVPRRVFLVHGDPDAQAALEPKVRALGFDVEIPQWRQHVELT